MPLTRLANTIIDGVAAAAPAIAAEIEKYLGSDLVCYRAEGPDRLVVRQAHQWDPFLAFACEQLGARFEITHEIVAILTDAQVREREKNLRKGRPVIQPVQREDREVVGIPADQIKKYR